MEEQTGADTVDEIHKTQEEWNGAGTFGCLVTLKKHEPCEKNAAQELRGLSRRTDDD